MVYFSAHGHTCRAPSGALKGHRCTAGTPMFWPVTRRPLHAKAEKTGQNTWTHYPSLCTSATGTVRATRCRALHMLVHCAHTPDFQGFLAEVRHVIVPALLPTIGGAHARIAGHLPHLRHSGAAAFISNGNGHVARCEHLGAGRVGGVQVDGGVLVFGGLASRPLRLHSLLTCLALELGLHSYRGISSPAALCAFALAARTAGGPLPFEVPTRVLNGVAPAVMGKAYGACGATVGLFNCSRERLVFDGAGVRGASSRHGCSYQRRCSRHHRRLQSGAVGRSLHHDGSETSAFSLRHSVQNCTSSQKSMPPGLQAGAAMQRQVAISE